MYSTSLLFRTSFEVNPRPSKVKFHQKIPLNKQSVNLNLLNECVVAERIMSHFDVNLVNSFQKNSKHFTPQ